MLDDPAAAAWRHTAHREVPFPARHTGEPCARCGDAASPTVRSAEIISEQFTGFDDWPYGTRRLCQPCAWAYYALPPTARAAHWSITAAGVTRHRTPRALGDALAAAPLGIDVAAIVSVSNRHYVLPGAQWGQLRCDRLSVTWTAARADTLTRIRRLRRLDARWVELAQMQPPRTLLARHPTRSWMAIADDWEHLQSWRANPTLWAAARTLTG